MKLSSIIAGIIICVLPFAPCKKTGLGFRDVTGTRLTETTWFGLFHQMEVVESPLAKWCTSHGIQLKENDYFYSHSTSGLLGYIACRHLPASARFEPQMQELYLQRAKEPAIREFVSQMSVADEAQKKKLFETVVERYLQL